MNKFKGFWLAAFFAMAYEIAQDKFDRRQFNLAFLLFHVENVKERLCLDFSQDRLYRWFVDGTIENQEIINVLGKANGLNPFAVSIKTKKLRLIRELRHRATSKGMEEAFNDLLRRNCYGLF
jgi:hypothetical protein